jgi:hypothetical protein
MTVKRDKSKGVHPLPGISSNNRRKRSSRPSVINIHDLSTESEMTNSNHTIISTNQSEIQHPVSLTLGTGLFPTTQDILLHRKNSPPLQVNIPPGGISTLNSLNNGSSSILTTNSSTNGLLMGPSGGLQASIMNANNTTSNNNNSNSINNNNNYSEGAQQNGSNTIPAAPQVMIEEINFERAVAPIPGTLPTSIDRGEAASTTRIGSYFGMETASLFDASGSNRSRLTFETNIPGVFSFIGQDVEGNMYSYSFSNNTSRSITVNNTNNTTNNSHTNTSVNNQGSNPQPTPQQSENFQPGGISSPPAGGPVIESTFNINSSTEGGATHSLRLGLLSQFENPPFGGGGLLGNQLGRQIQMGPPDNGIFSNSIVISNQPNILPITSPRFY